LRWVHGRLRAISREAGSSMDGRRDEARETMAPRVKMPYRQVAGASERVPVFA